LQNWGSVCWSVPGLDPEQLNLRSFWAGRRGWRGVPGDYWEFIGYLTNFLHIFGQPCQQISKWCCIFWETLSFQGIMFFQGVVLCNLCLLGASIGELRPGLLPIISCIFCFRLNKALKNLTSLRQHHLQYTGGLAETGGLLLQSLYCNALYPNHRTHTDIF
jgi:hypothetical protein